MALAAPWLVLGQAGARQAGTSLNASIEQELIGLESEWNEALKRSDAVSLDPLMADDYMVTDWAGGVTTKAQNLADVKSGGIKLASAVNDEYKIHIYGSTAVVNYRATIKGQANGADISGRYRETDTWVKHGGHWQCVAAHFSKLVDGK